VTGLRRQPIACQNLNHRRSNAPVPYCPECGDVVNSSIPRRACSMDEHAVSRRRGSVYCVACGKQLIVRNRA
jgi:ribosomal protein L34E